MIRVNVTGMGIVSAIGNNVTENLESLRAGKKGIKTPLFFDSKYASELLFGEVNINNNDLSTLLNLENQKGYTRTDYLAFKAFKEAIFMANVSKEELSSFDTAFISASTVGGMCMTNQLYEDANLISKELAYIESYGGSAHTLKIADYFNIKGYTDTINTACSSSANAIMLGAKLIKSGRAKRVIVGGVDSLAKYTVNGFSSLQILSKSYCAPFDENRDGLNLGEGAAYLVLEAEEISKNKTIFAEVTGYGNSNDAYHASSLSENAIGVKEAMSKALLKASLSVNDIDYINTHGTATNNNDQVELQGIYDMFENIPPYNSTKSYTGHTLGAAGAIEAIYSIFSLMYQELYASLNCVTPISKFNIAPISNYQKNNVIKNVLSNSFGFGGNCTSLVLTSSSYNK